MNESFKRLQRLIPDRVPPARNGLDTRPSALRTWLDQLPYANLGLLSSRLIGALREMNATAIDPQRRLDALEMLRSPVLELIAGLSKRMHGDTFPMRDARLQAGELVQDFERELVTGYTEVVCDLCAPLGKIPFLRGRVVALALTRAIQYEEGRLWNAYQMHAAAAVGIWQGLHDLFLFAVATDVDGKGEADALSAGIKVSARSAYVHALLHAFIKPYHFTQRENTQINDVLPALASWCDVKPGLAPAGAIAICVSGDQSPPSPPRDRRVDLNELWMVDVSVLLQQLEKSIERLSPGDESVRFVAREGYAVKLQAALAGTLIRIWSGRSERASPRHSERAVLQTAVGLQAVHSILFGNVDFDTFQRLALGDQRDNRAEVVAARASGRVNLQLPHAQLLDRALGGFRLRWERTEDVRARVGELVAVAAVDDVRQLWHVGVLRWLRVDVYGAVEAGLALLHGRTEAVGVRSLDAQGIARPQLRGILIVPDAPDSGGTPEPYIVVPHVFDREALAFELTRFDESRLQDAAHVDRVTELRMLNHDSLYLYFGVPLGVLRRGPWGDAANDYANVSLVQIPPRS